MRPSHLETRYKFDLSPRQREVIELVARGRTNAEIAESLGISLDGAKYHVREILGKLGVESREEAAAAWRASRTPSGRIRQMSLGLAGMRGAPIVWAGAASFVVAIAAVVVLVALRQGDDAPAALPDVETSTPTTEPSASPLAAATGPATNTAAGAQCTSSDASLRLELVPDGQDVLVQLFAAGAASCLLLGPGSLSVLQGPPAQGQWDPYVNTVRAFKVSAELPVAEPLLVWRWMNQCAQLGPSGWRAELAGLETTVTVNVRPGCVAPGSPMIVALDNFATAPGILVDGETTADPACVDRTAGWLCEFATRTANRVIRGDLAMVVQDGEARTYTCDGGDVFSSICVGQADGDVVRGFPIALHGSAGGPRSPDDLVSELDDALDSGDGPFLAAIGCPDAEPDCSTFFVAFNTRGSPTVAYLVFELFPGHEPALVGAGLSGDNAADILGGGTTMTGSGPVTFVALPPPP